MLLPAHFYSCGAVLASQVVYLLAAYSRSIVSGLFIQCTAADVVAGQLSVTSEMWFVVSICSPAVQQCPAYSVQNYWYVCTHYYIRRAYAPDMLLTGLVNACKFPQCSPHCVGRSRFSQQELALTCPEQSTTA